MIDSRTCVVSGRINVRDVVSHFVFFCVVVVCNVCRRLAYLENIKLYSYIIMIIGALRSSGAPRSSAELERRNLQKNQYF